MQDLDERYFLQLGFAAQLCRSQSVLLHPGDVDVCISFDCCLLFPLLLQLCFRAEVHLNHIHLQNFLQRADSVRLPQQIYAPEGDPLGGLTIKAITRTGVFQLFGLIASMIKRLRG